MEKKDEKITSVAVGDYFLTKGPMYLTKLQKMVYYAYCFYMVYRNSSMSKEDHRDCDYKRLFDERPCAWQYGPVFPNLYEYHVSRSNNYKQNQDKENLDPFEPIEIPKLSKDKINNVIASSEELKSFLDYIYKAFSKYTAFELTNMTHNEKPWIETEYLKEIEDNKIFNFFSKALNVKK